MWRGEGFMLRGRCDGGRVGASAAVTVLRSDMRSAHARCSHLTSSICIRLSTDVQLMGDFIKAVYSLFRSYCNWLTN